MTSGMNLSDIMASCAISPASPGSGIADLRDDPSGMCSICRCFDTNIAPIIRSDLSHAILMLKGKCPWYFESFQPGFGIDDVPELEIDRPSVLQELKDYVEGHAVRTH